MMQVGMGFGTLLERILVDFGSNLGGKLGPSWLQNQSKIDQRTMLKKGLKIASKNVTQHDEAREGVGPLKSTNPDLQGPTWALDTPLGH